MAILQGCIPSLYPIYTADKLVEIKALTGTWAVSNDNKAAGKQTETWQFKKAGGKSYHLVHRDEQGYQAAFEVHVIKLGNHFFMDFFPMNLKEAGIEIVDQMNSMQSYHLLPVHTFAKLEVNEGALSVKMFDPDFLKDLLERQQIRIKHEEPETGYILTASPEELQKFAQKYAEVKQAFLSDPVILKPL